MDDYLEIPEELLPEESTFHLSGPGTLITSLYLKNLADRIERGLKDVPDEAEFIDSFQMDVLLFFVVATEDIKEHCREALAERVVSPDIHSTEEYNESSIIDQLSDTEMLDEARHYGIITGVPGEKSIDDLIRFRNKLVHRPEEFASEPLEPLELIAYINSAIAIVEFFEDEEY